jgi:gluconolactonase
MSYNFHKIVDGIPGAEGPVFDLLDRLFVVSPTNGEVLLIDENNGNTCVHAQTNGIPAGLQVDGQNNLWVADMKHGIFKITPHGELTHAVDSYAQASIRGCNDCAFDQSGNLYFSAPAGSNAEQCVGEVYCLKRDGTVALLDDGYAFSNGLAVSADQTLLVVAETFTKKLWGYEIQQSGQVSNKREFATLPGDHGGGPDGMDFDIEGNLLVANWGGSSIEVFDTSGLLIERIATPFEKPSNLHFGGDDGCTLIITEHTHDAVWRTRWRQPGLTTQR